MSEGVAIVAGAGTELGRATAEKLAAAGFAVTGVDQNQEALKGLPDGIHREAADPAAARSVVDRIAAGVGPPQVLVNTAGTYCLGEALTATPEDLRLMIDLNAGPALWLTRAVVPYLRDRGSGSIVHVAAPPGPGAGRLRRQQGRPGPPHPRSRPGAASARDPGGGRARLQRLILFPSCRTSGKDDHVTQFSP